MIAMRPIGAAIFDRSDASATVIGLLSDSVAEADERFFERVLLRRSTLVVAGSGTWRDFSLAIALQADYFAIGASATMVIWDDVGRNLRSPGIQASVTHLRFASASPAADDAPRGEMGGSPEPWNRETGEPSGYGAVAGGIVRRIGRAALPLLLSKSSAISASEAVSLGLADGIVPDGADAGSWIRQWIGDRSVPALHAGASLVRRSGGDIMERAEFARLFATGEPQRGLGRFLDKEPLDFSDDLIAETI